ncbi:MAG: hypothetical protein M3R12_13095 [Actinomycetota bacterium]|nr:hypothetical protein [Actinomycetota bacterium]
MLGWIWRSRLTVSAAVVVTTATCLAIFAGTGIGGMPGLVVSATTIVVWLFVVSRLLDNEARHVAAVAQARGRPIPVRRLRRLLFPWWARGALSLVVLAVTAASVWVLDGDGAVGLTFVLALAGAWAIERAVIALRAS